MKKISKKNERILISVAVALICIAIAGVVYLALDMNGTFDEPEVTTIAPETTIPTASIQHEDVETQLYEDGTLKKIVYYKENVLDGSVDFVYRGDSVYEIHYDKNNELIQTIKTQINIVGSVIYESVSDAEKKLMETEYVYYDDLTTLWKKTVIEYREDGVEAITKLIYSEDSLMTDKYVYEDSEEISHTVYTYDENGELISENEVA